MALATAVPPWLDITPSFFTGAMERGAQLGLSARSQDTEERSSADRLRLAYDQLGSLERRESEAAAAKLELAQSAQELKAQQFQSAQELRAQQLDALQQWRQTTEDRKEQEAAARFGLSQSAQDLRAQQAADLQQYRSALLESRKKAPQGDAADVFRAKHELPTLYKRLSDATDLLQSQGPRVAPHGPFGLLGNADSFDKKKKDVDELTARIKENEDLLRGKPTKSKRLRYDPASKSLAPVDTTPVDSGDDQEE